MIVRFDETKVRGYDPNKKYLLNIRKDANPASEVIGAKEPGEEFEVDALDAGRPMTALAEGGYAMTEYLTVADGACQPVADGLGEPTEVIGAKEPGEEMSIVNAEDGVAALEDDGSDAAAFEPKEPDTSKLEAMEREDLLKLAKESGIKVRSNASKGTIIAALMADED